MMNGGVGVDRHISVSLRAGKRVRGRCVRGLRFGQVWDGEGVCFRLAGGAVGVGF